MGPKLLANKLDKSFETLARIQDNITGLDIESSFILEMYVIYINVILFFFPFKWGKKKFKYWMRID